MGMEFSRNTVKTKSKRWFIAISVVLILLVSFGFYVLKTKHANSLARDQFSSSMSKVKTWFSENKSHLNQKIVRVKQLAANKPDNEPVIHFEFYNTLAHATVAVPDITTVASSNKTIAASKYPMENPEVKRNQEVASSKSASKNLFFDPKELEQDVSQQIKNHSYVIHSNKH